MSSEPLMPDAAVEAAIKANLHPLAEPSETERQHMRKSLLAALPHLRPDGEAVAWRWNYEDPNLRYTAWLYQEIEPDWLRGRGYVVQPLYLAPPASPDVAALVEAVREADRQLAYLDERSPSGTTPAVRARIASALSTISQPGGRNG